MAAPVNTRGAGRRGEALAADYLRSKGFSIVETNYTCRIGEIDIVARKGKSLCFIEVKLRKGPSFGSPLDAVDARKREKLFRTAQYYCLERKQTGQPLRFDVVGIVIDDGESRITHIENAFS